MIYTIHSLMESNISHVYSVKNLLLVSKLMSTWCDFLI